MHIDDPARRADEIGMFFIDTVLEDFSAQDTITTANVLDSVCLRLKKELPRLEDVVLVSCNVPNYVNLTMPLMAFYIFKSHYLLLMEVLHPEPQQSKNIYKTHTSASVADRLTNKYSRITSALSSQMISQKRSYMMGGLQIRISTASNRTGDRREYRGCSRLGSSKKL